MTNQVSLYLLQIFQLLLGIFIYTTAEISKSTEECHYSKLSTISKHDYNDTIKFPYTCATENYAARISCQPNPKPAATVNGTGCILTTVIFDKIEDFSSTALESILLSSNFDSDTSIRQISIKISLLDNNDDYKSLKTKIVSMGTEIDRFLVYRPWWNIIKEPYVWQFESEATTSTTRISNSGADTATHAFQNGAHSGRDIYPIEVIFQRISREFEPYLKLVTHIQYPSVKRCNTTPLLVGTYDGGNPGWASILGMYEMSHAEMPLAIHNFFVNPATKNQEDDHTAFISGSDCLEVPSILAANFDNNNTKRHRNYWQCAFYPTSNCTIPDIITTCQGLNCVHKTPTTFHYSIMFPTATQEAQLITQKDAIGPLMRIAYKKPNSNNTANVNTELISNQLLTTSHIPRYILPRDPNNCKWGPFYGVNLRESLFSFQFLLRKTSFYRAKIAQKIESFRQEHRFDFSKRCIAVHIRRGDRAVAAGNVTEFCIKHKVEDYGCKNVPFASVELKHILETANWLVEGKDVSNLIVATDDEKWLSQQILYAAGRSEFSHWNVLHLNAPHRRSSIQNVNISAIATTNNGDKNNNNRNDNKKPSSAELEYQHMRHKAGTDSGVFLHASMELFHQCEAFIGHFGSGTSQIMYRSMCMARGGTCPAVYDMRHYEPLSLRYLYVKNNNNNNNIKNHSPQRKPPPNKPHRHYTKRLLDELTTITNKEIQSSSLSSHIVNEAEEDCIAVRNRKKFLRINHTNDTTYSISATTTSTNTNESCLDAVYIDDDSNDSSTIENMRYNNKKNDRKFVTRKGVDVNNDQKYRLEEETFEDTESEGEDGTSYDDDEDTNHNHDDNFTLINHLHKSAAVNSVRRNTNDKKMVERINREILFKYGYCIAPYDKYCFNDGITG